MWVLWQGLFKALAVAGAHAVSHRRQAIQLHGKNTKPYRYNLSFMSLRQIKTWDKILIKIDSGVQEVLCRQIEPASPHANPFQRQKFPMFPLSEIFCVEVLLKQAPRVGLYQSIFKLLIFCWTSRAGIVETRLFEDQVPSSQSPLVNAREGHLIALRYHLGMEQTVPGFYQHSFASSLWATNWLFNHPSLSASQNGPYMNRKIWQ